MDQRNFFDVGSAENERNVLASFWNRGCMREPKGNETSEKSARASAKPVRGRTGSAAKLELNQDGQVDAVFDFL
jgi:hypothetical protein